MLNKFTSLGELLRQVRISKKLLLRQVAASLEVDTAYISKLERDEKRATREQIRRLSEFLGINEHTLIEIWLADKIMNIITGEEDGIAALKIAAKRMKEQGVDLKNKIENGK
jgi:HTH-type transcriptional regulator, competence development regulator